MKILTNKEEDHIIKITAFYNLTSPIVIFFNLFSLFIDGNQEEIGGVTLNFYLIAYVLNSDFHYRYIFKKLMSKRFLKLFKLF